MRDFRWKPLKVSSGSLRLDSTQLELPLQSKQRMRWVVQEDLFSQDIHLGSFRSLVPNETIAAVFGIAVMCKNQEFVFCTKHINRKIDWFEWIENDIDGPSHGCLLHLQDVVGIRAIGKELIAHQQQWPLSNTNILYFIGKMGVQCE